MILLAAINWHTFFFLMFAVVACVFGLAVLLSSNIVRMAFYLVLSLGATAGIFFLAGAEFVGAMQLMIYVGGTLVLLIFGVMLTAQEAFITMRTRSGEWIAAILLGGVLLAVLLGTAFSVDQWSSPSPQWQLQATVTNLTELADRNSQMAERAERIALADSPDADQIERLAREQQRAASEYGELLERMGQLAGADTVGIQDRRISQSVRRVQDELSGAATAKVQALSDNIEVWRKLSTANSTSTATTAPASGRPTEITSNATELATVLRQASNQLRGDLQTVAESKQTTPIGEAFAGVRVDKIEQPDEVLRRGMSGYVLPFVIASVHLVVVLIGAAYMARPKQRAARRTGRAAA